MVKNKKGFTLIELIAVIIILGIILVISGVAVISSFQDTKDDVATTQEEIITSSAKAYFNENLNFFSRKNTPDICEDEIDGDNIKRTCTINSDTLVSENYIDQPKDINTKENISYLKLNNFLFILI